MSKRISVVLPCLNEADTLETCLGKAREGLEQTGLEWEIVVADNGSTDGSREIARRRGARVVPVAARGYGHALMAGIEAASGDYVLMGDADDSYDFREIPKFVRELEAGAQLVQGCRLPGGGGRILPGAMPPLHRWIGNPLLTFLVRHIFRAPVHDVYCGMRAFTRELYRRLALRCTGMEFATEMIIKASMMGADCAEVPISLYPDGRKSHAPHLKTFRDGWRTLRFYLLYSPRWLFLYPGVLLGVLAVLGYAVVFSGMRLGAVTFEAHTLLFASLAAITGYQSLTFALLAKIFAVNEGLLPPDWKHSLIFRALTLERGLALCGLLVAAGSVFLLWVVAEWTGSGFGHLDYAVTMKRAVPGFTLFVLGYQTFMLGFFTSLLGMAKN